MTSFFCPNCWASVAASVKICPCCGTDIAQWQSQNTYGDQLIAALRHQVPTTPVIAAQILGERREQKAIPALIKMLNTTADAYLAAAAVEALNTIGGTEAVDAVPAALRHRFARVRRPRAREILQDNCRSSVHASTRVSKS